MKKLVQSFQETAFSKRAIGMRCSRNLRKLSRKELELLLKFHSEDINETQLTFLCSQEEIDKSVITESIKDLDDYLFSVRTMMCWFWSILVVVFAVAVANFLG